MRSALSPVGKSELHILIMLVLVVALTWLFVGIAEEVLEGDLRSFDRTVLLALRDASDRANLLGPPWVEEMVRDITALGSTIVLSLVSVAVIGFLLLLQRPKMALLVAVAVIGGIVIGTFLKLGFGRPRPDLVPHATRVYTASFPSGHSMESAVVYLTLGALVARILPEHRLKVYVMLLMISLTLIIGFSRIYLGVHWPTDVLAGWAAGSAWALLCWLAAYWLQRRSGSTISPSQDTL